MGKRTKQSAQPAFSRRAFLRAAGIGAVVAAAGAGIYLATPRSFDMSFLDAKLFFEPVVYCSEPEILEPDEALKRNLADRIQKDPRIKQEWWSRAKAQPANMHFTLVTKRRAYVPESNARWANAYLDYCVEAMGDAFKNCGFSRYTVRPRVFGTESPPVESAGIVNTICDIYNVDVTLSAPGTPPLKTAYTMAMNEHLRGGFQARVTYNKVTKTAKMAKASPLLLTTTGGGERHEQLFTPFAEALHWIIASATMKGVETAWQENYSDPDAQTRQWVKTDEAVAHSVGRVLFARFAKKHGLKVGDNDDEAGMKAEQRFAQYALVPRVWEYARKTGTDLVKRYIDNPFEVRKKIESGNVSW